MRELYVIVTSWL